MRGAKQCDLGEHCASFISFKKLAPCEPIPVNPEIVHGKDKGPHRRGLSAIG
jgi:hypothetical protein